MAHQEQEAHAPQDGTGIPDGFQRLWMPHRMAYIKGEGKPVTGTNNRYFAEHPEMVLGEEGFFDKLYEGSYAVRPRPDQDLVKDLHGFGLSNGRIEIDSRCQMPMAKHLLN